MKNRLANLTAAILLIFGANCSSPPAKWVRPATSAPRTKHWLSPTALVASADGRTLFIACATASQVAVFDTSTGKITRRIAVPDSPSGLALSADGSRLYVTCVAPASTVCVVDTVAGKVVKKIAAGHTAMSPVISPDGRTLYVCNRFDNSVSAIDLESGGEIRRIGVAREPIAAALTPDGKLLLVANHIHNGRADLDVVAAKVSVIETATGAVLREIQLPNGSTLLLGVAISPDGRYAAVTHILARFHLPTTQIERGWINTNALSLIDLVELKLLNTVLLDNVDSGAANPWAVAWSRDGKQICVTHAGTHEVSVIDAPALLEKLKKISGAVPPGQLVSYGGASRTAADVPNDLAFMVGIRERIRLDGKGPRALVLAGNKAYAANYFSDSLSVVDLSSPRPRATSLALQAPPKMSVMRKGELNFNDAALCFQGWQSCASCHSYDARVDGMNWDLLNDGIGNPKNSKSLLLAHRTPPTTSLAVREDASLSVRSGIRFILFTVQPEEEAVALDEYLQSLRPMRSPYLAAGKLSAAAQRGKKLFMNPLLGCADCHGPPLFTDLKSHEVGTRGQFDKPEDKFDTPTLIELWRTGPYLHDGSAATLRDVLTTGNRADLHGKTSHLTSEQIDDLVAYLLSL